MELIKQIDCAEAIYEALRTPMLKGTFTDTMSLAVSLIKEVPTIDAEPIVRCKDCKKHSSENELHEVFCEAYEAVKSENGYCDWGERMDGGEDDKKV